jgi:hypothetical protein
MGLTMASSVSGASERPNNHVDRRSRFSADVVSPLSRPNESKRKALEALAVGVKTEGYDTKNDTKRVDGAILLATDEKNGGDDGTRTRGLCRDSENFICN